MKFVMTLAFLVTSFSTWALSVTTYNAGLANNYVPLTKERTPFIMKELAAFKTDILCLQEVWEKKDRETIVKNLKKDYPYIHLVDLKQKRASKAPTCRIKQLFGDGKFVSCSLKECKGVEGDAYTECILNKCGGALTNLIKSDRECATALMSQVDKSAIGAVATVLNPLVRAPLFTYKGSNGLILLSKKKFASTDYLDWSDDSTLSRRGALKATLESGEEVFCTHLSANLTNVPYTGKFGSWEGENKVQAEYLAEKALMAREGSIILGDFNFSPSMPEVGVDGDLEENYEIFSRAGLDVSIDYTANPSCTFCEANTLVGESKDMILDHVFSSGLTPVRARRVFENKVQINGQAHNLSDHYGVEMIFEE